jgi:deoxycytidylate deaminase
MSLKTLVSEIALKTALKSSMNTQYSCVVTLRGKIISTGFNAQICDTMRKTMKKKQCILRG